MGYYGRLNTEEKRLAYREYEVAGFDLTRYEEEKTDVYTKDENGRYYLKIFNGTAGKPSCYYSFRSEQAREKYISDHLEGRRRHFERINARKNANKNPETVQVTHAFEVGREYIRSWSYDGDDHSTVCKVVKRTPQFVTIQERGDRERRCKIGIYNGVENIHPDSLTGYYANEVLPTEEEREEQRRREEAEREAVADRLKEAAEVETEQITAIIEKFPHEDGRPFVIVEWVEGYDCTIQALCKKNLSIAAADLIFSEMDNRRHNDPDFLGYDKCKFILCCNGENYSDRYDMGDGYGGLLRFLSTFNIVPPTVLEQLAEDEKQSLEAAKKAIRDQEPERASNGGKVVCFADYKKRKEEKAEAEKQKENEDFANGLEISISTLTAQQTSAAIDRVLNTAEQEPAAWALPALSVLGKMLDHLKDISPDAAYQKFRDCAERIKALQIASERSSPGEDLPRF